MSIKNSPAFLGSEPIGKLLIQYSIPAIVAMIATSLYNIIDSIFIGHGVGSLAIAGLALTFPLMNLSAAFGSLVGMGAATTISVKLGQNDTESANRILGNVMTLNLIIGVVYTIIMLAFLDPILYFFKASEQTIGYARDFMRVILYGNVVTHSYFGLNAVLRASGHPKIAMNATLATVVINVALNPLFIFGFGWGIQGSALATVISQTIALIFQLWFFSRKTLFIHFKKGIYKLRKEIVTSIMAIGLSPFLMNAFASIVVLFINTGLAKHGGDMSIGAYGIVNRTLFLFIMVANGINQGMQPIAGYNYGARQYGRVVSVTKLSIIFGVCVMSVGFILAEFFPELPIRMFTSDPELIKASVYGMRIMGAIFPLVGFQIVASNYFMSIGMAKIAIFLSLSRQLLFLLPFLIILPQFIGLKGVWLSMPLSDLVSVIITGIVFFHYIRKMKSQVDETPHS